MAFRQLSESRKISPQRGIQGLLLGQRLVETFFSIFEHELGLDDEAEPLSNPQQLIRPLAFRIDSYYNREHLHSTIGYFS